MSALTGSEPDLQLGDSGEGVALLQIRLYQLGLYRQFPDSTYDMATENAVRELQSTVGQDNDGVVTRATWEAILDLEQRYGIQYQYVSPYDAIDQLRYDLDHPASASGDFSTADPSLSADGQWRWDGNDWQPAYAQAAEAVAATSHTGTVSEDGQWRWDGYQWQANTEGAQSGEHHAGYAGMLSDDGQWRWDGNQWQVA